jgi:HEAT repeat protein
MTVRKEVEAAGARSLRKTTLVLLGLASAGAADFLLLTAALKQTLPVEPALAAHAAVATLLGLALVPVSGDRTMALLASLALASLGPFGTLVVAPLAMAPRGDTQRRERWYRELTLADARDPIRELHTAIVEGRAYVPRRVSLPNLSRIMADGSVVQRQVVLGLIAQRFHPDYQPLLASGLRSSEAAVRVSAAAIHVKLRDAGRQAAERGGVSP